MSLKQIDCLTYLNKLLSPEIFDDYAPNGLQVEGKDNLKSLAFAVSATQESIEKAIKLKADALIVHHGVLWKHQGARPISGPWGKRIKELIKNELNLFAYHLPLDAHFEIGNARAFADELSMKKLAPFALYKKQPLGIKGELSKPLKAKDLKTKLAQICRPDIILSTPNENALIKSIGIITGGANNEWTSALNDKLDAYITGEISEYNWHDAKEAGIHYFACGHHASERFGIMALMNRMKKDYPKIKMQFIDSENPV